MNNGYTQIEIDGQTIGIKFGLPALEMLMQKAVEFPTILNAQTAFSSAGLAYLLYYGYINNCMVKEAVPVHKFEFFMDYVESVAHDTEAAKPLAGVIEIWAASREVKRIIPVTREDVKKKNGSLKKSKPIAMAH